jgi:hypothetical protein
MIRSPGPGDGKQPDGGTEKPGGDRHGEKDEPDEVPEGLKRFFGGSWEQTTRYADAAYSLVGSLLGLGMIGWLADRAFGTRPRWLLIGLLVGGVVGFYRLGRAMLTRR